MTPPATPDTAIAEQLNQGCHCVGVDPSELESSLFRGMADAELVRSLKTTHRNLFSSSPVFVAPSHLASMQRTVNAIEAAVATPSFRASADTRLRAAGLTPPSAGAPALLSYDFHIADTGPQLIEINTNPGGVLLGMHIQSAQEACCAEVEDAHLTQTAGWSLASPAEMEAVLVEMVTANADRSNTRVAIIDQDPRGQFLYPEFVLYQQLFERHGISTRILDPQELRFDGSRLHHEGWPIDAIYNRSTDFQLDQPESEAAKRAWQAGGLWVSPDPIAWSLYADKRNLVTLSDRRALERLTSEQGHLDEAAIAHLIQAVPEAHILDSQSAEDLFNQRKQFFFKPMDGHGSRGTYDGKKISRPKFDQIVDAGYIAQRRIPPSERRLLLDETEVDLKLDLRAVTWKGRILMLMARMYRGQTTNMRTEGGGLATALVFNTAKVPTA